MRNSHRRGLVVMFIALVIRIWDSNLVELTNDNVQCSKSDCSRGYFWSGAESLGLGLCWLQGAGLGLGLG